MSDTRETSQALDVPVCEHGVAVCEACEVVIRQQVEGEQKKTRIALLMNAKIVRGDFTQICSYCVGWEAPPDGGWEALQAHIRECPAHPLPKAIAALAASEAEAQALREQLQRIAPDRSGEPLLKILESIELDLNAEHERAEQAEADAQALRDWKASALESLNEWHRCGETLLELLPAGESHLGERIQDVLSKRIPEIVFRLKRADEMQHVVSLPDKHPLRIRAEQAEAQLAEVRAENERLKASLRKLASEHPDPTYGL